MAHHAGHSGPLRGRDLEIVMSGGPKRAVRTLHACRRWFCGLTRGFGLEECRDPEEHRGTGSGGCQDPSLIGDSSGETELDSGLVTPNVPDMPQTQLHQPGDAVPVYVVSDQGPCSHDLWAQIVVTVDAWPRLQRSSAAGGPQRRLNLTRACGAGPSSPSTPRPPWGSVPRGGQIDRSADLAHSRTQTAVDDSRSPQGLTPPHTGLARCSGRLH